MSLCAFTIGHSTHSEAAFVALVKCHSITAVCDVRSQPYSHIAPHYNRESIMRALHRHGIAYLFLGDHLGARSEDPSCYEHGRVLYARLASTDIFRRGLARVMDGIVRYRVALMCAEAEPLDCHRTILISRQLHENGVAVRHIHASGKLEAHDDALTRLMCLLRIPESDMFRSRAELIADAYDQQEQRIGYRPPRPSEPYRRSA